MTEPKQDTGGLDVLILGGGIAGLATALALTHFAPGHAVPRIRIFEIRAVAAAQGGAINLTPNALRLLDHLGVWAVIRARGYGRDMDEIEVFDAHAPPERGPLAVSSFRGPTGAGLGHPPHKALRITRGDVLRALLEAAGAHANITLAYGAHTVAITEHDAGVRLAFADGSAAAGDVLLGCDGIHSAARRLHVDPARAATYTGVCSALGFAALGDGPESLPPLHFGGAALNFARRGLLLTSYHDPTQASVYIGALVAVADVGSRDGWRQAGADAARTRADLLARFGNTSLPCLRPLLERVADFYLWPVFTLSKEGVWSTPRCMLLGDAAHAMPPQGESTGIVFEDTVILSRCLARWLDKGRPGGGPGEAFAAYERLRRPRIAAAFKESRAVVRSVLDVGWLGHYVKTCIIPWYIWFTRSRRERHFVEDVTRCELDY